MAEEKRRIPRKDRRGMNPITVAAIALVIAGAGIWLGFTKDIPFTQGFRMSAVFETSNNLRKNSPVRIAGVEVGRVKEIKRFQDTDMAEVVMEINEKGLPIHKDATAKIRPRIFLEGNFFVDLSPGTPEAPHIDKGDTIPPTQTSAPVQLDQVLSALQNDTREDLKTLLDEFGTALQGAPAESDRLMEGAGDDTRGETAAESLNDTYDDAGPALKGVSIVNEAFLGTEPRDLSRAIAGLQRVTAALGRNERTLQDFVENFNTTLAIFADEKENVGATFRELAGTLPQADRALAALNRSFPSTRAFAREILPGVRETPATIDAARPWIAQARRLMGPNELQGLARDLRPTTADLAKATDGALTLFPLQNMLAKCQNEVVLPTGDIKITEPEGRKQFETGVENYKEFWYAMTALASEGQNFDGNGAYVRFQPGGGTQTLGTGRSNNGSATQFFNTASPPLGTRPVYPGKRPPYRPDVQCHTQKIPNLNGARVGAPDGSQGPGGGAPPPGPSTSPPGGTQIPSIPLMPSRSVATAAPAVAGGLPSVPPVARGARRTVAGELVSRLNPFRTTPPRKKAARAKAERKAVAR
jgi:phospholipid/cholesterol/gamma-HCH transport system substrate-binding protein